MKSYDHKKIESKWQKKWEKERLYETKSPATLQQSSEQSESKNKFYSLIEFPYPSGDGLHVGHPRPYIGMDIISRKKRMEGYNVLYPIGWDAFGLPTENYAIKTGVHPKIVTKKNTDNFRKQIKMLGISFDWKREINTTDPKYYKWTQWIFLQMFKKGLAYKAKSEINWCPKDKIGLANEEVVNGKCERCGTEVERREKEQWMLAITKYADRLDKDLDSVDYSPQIKTQQRNWIGRSEGSEFEFELRSTGKDLRSKIKVFTTRADTLFGVTYIVLSPENPLIKEVLPSVNNKEEVQKYILDSKNKSEIERTDDKKDKTGVELKGIKVVNPATKEEVHVWVADYVLPNYGTGAVMAVPAHDQRDFEFAEKYNLPVKFVLMHYDFDQSNPPREGKQDTTRDVVHVILRNPKDKTVLIEFLKGEEWGKDKPKNFIIGGIEEGESEMEAAIREVKEETGYKNIKFIEEIPLQSSATFFAAHKDVNRTVYVRYLVFDLIDESRDEIIEDEYFTKDSHEIRWIPYEEVASTLTVLGNKLSWKYFYDGKFVYTGEGVLTNSGEFNKMSSKEAMGKITEKFGKKNTTYKLRDWVFSRQRYWGEPIPLIHCEKCALQDPSGQGWVAVSEKDLPVKLPEVKNYKPSDDGESPLANISKWINVKCPICGGAAQRETDVMPNWAGSSWYFLRYTDFDNDKEFASKKNLEYWLPVDWYNGGMEHTTLHLLYSRFWHKFLYDMKLVPTNEPYKKRTSHGLILAKGGEKMSKSRGNVINPDDVVKTWGADTLRLYEMFMGPFGLAIEWNTDNMIGVRRFIERVWKLQFKSRTEDNKLETLLNKTIKKVTEDIESMSFNTAVSAMMILVNEMDLLESLRVEDYEVLLKLLSPFAPHVTEEIWNNLNHKQSVTLEEWPVFNPEKIIDSLVNIAIQINGKLRAILKVNNLEDESVVKDKALQMTDVKKWIDGKEIKRTIFVPNKILNLII